MLARFRELKTFIEQFYLNESLNKDIKPLTNEEWKYINYLVEILLPFRQFTDTINAIKNGLIIYNVFTVYNELFKYIEKHRDKLQRKRLL